MTGLVRTASAVVLATGVAVLAACSPPESSEGDSSGSSVDVVDASGTSHTVNVPARVGCLWYGCTEDFADLGVVPTAAGVSKSELDSAFLFPVGPPEHRINDTTSIDEWAAAEPDLIVTIEDDNPDFDALDQVAPIFRYYSIYSPGDIDGVEQLKQNLRNLGELIGETDAADEAIGRYDALLETLEATSSPETAERSVALLYATDDGTYQMPRPLERDLACEAIEDSQLGTCIPGTESGAINAEELLRLDPDWIVYSGGEGMRAADRDDPVWSQLTAVKNGQVYDTDNYLVGESLRILYHMLQEFGYHSMPDADIPDPGPFFDFDPLQSGVSSNG